MKHAVVLVNYGGWRDTLACIASIQQAHNPPHIIVVDNASKDESVAQIRRAYPEVELLELTENTGFAGGNNHGMRRALAWGAEVVYLLNNDTVVDPHLFVTAYRAVHGQRQILGAKIRYAAGYEFHADQKERGDVLWYAGGDIDWSAVVGRHRGVDEIDQGQYDQSEKTEFITGCFMAIPREVIHELGFFDEKYFLYLEDADYCLRANRHHITRIYEPRCRVYHRNSATSGVGSCLVDYYLTRNRLYFGWKYGTNRLRFHLLREGFFKHIRTRVRRQAFFDFLSGRMGSRHEMVCQDTNT